MYICGHTSSYMHMLNSSFLGNEKWRGPVVYNVRGVQTNTKKNLNGTIRFGYFLTFNLLTMALLPWQK